MFQASLSLIHNDFIGMPAAVCRRRGFSIEAVLRYLGRRRAPPLSTDWQC